MKTYTASPTASSWLTGMSPDGTKPAVSAAGPARPRRSPSETGDGGEHEALDDLLRMSRKRLAPSADRITRSRCRATARDSIRFATFAHAINSTSPTIAANTAAKTGRKPAMRDQAGAVFAE